MKFFVLYFLTALIILLSCEKEMQTASRFSSLPEFTEIELNSTFDVYINEDTVYSIEIIAAKDFIEDIVFIVDSNVLKISNDRGGKWLSPGKNKVELYINSKPLSKVSANQTCNVKTLSPITSHEFGLILASKANEASLELACYSFYYWNNFPTGGKLKLSGTTEKLKIWNTAIMTVDAKDLTARFAHIENSSKGNCEVTVLERFEYSITGIGDIHLYGSPYEIIKNQVTSSGQLIQY